MKKVMFIVYSGSCGGAERVVSRLSDYLANKGMECSIVIFSEQNDFFKNDKVKIIPLALNRKSALKKFWSATRKLRKVMKQEKPDTIVSFLDYQNICVILAHRFLSSKLIVSERNDPLKRSKIIRKACNFFYRFADHVVFQSEYAKACYPKKIRKNGHLIANPLPCDMSVAYPYEGFDSSVIMTASRLNTQKNIPLLIHAMVNIHRIYPNFQLKIFGTGPLQEEMEHLIKEEKAELYISLEGFSTKVCDEMKTSRLFVLSSDYEGVSNAMLEALAIGIPVISTKTDGGATTYIQHQKNGYLVEKGNVEELTNTMQYLLENKSICQELHRQSIKMNQQLSMNEIGKKWLEIL